MTRREGIPILLLLLAGALVACSGGQAATSSPASGAPAPAATASPAPAALTILAAASLKNALDQVKTAYEAAHPGTTLTISTDSSAALETQIELGQGDAAIVYVTDAKASTKVEAIDPPAAANVPATYAGVVVKASTEKVAAQAFLDWLAGPDGQAILATFGFLPLT